jgi:heat shock protein HtpX
MKYVGMQTQISRNNALSIFLLLMFPIIMLIVVWAFLALLNLFGNNNYDRYGNVVHSIDIATVNYYFISSMPWVVMGVGVWFIIAYFANVSIISRATGSQPLSRKDNPRIYNIVENLCMSCNMDMPKINIVNDAQLNAFASGINRKSYTITLTSGIINLLSDEELSGVIGHELTHIRNRDTRLLITSVIFVGIVSTIMTLIVRLTYNLLWFGVGGKNDRENKNGGISFILILIVGLLCISIAYLFMLLTRFAISRKREYMADAGGAELSGNPLALASALRKISQNPGLGQIKRDDIAQLFIIHPCISSQGIMKMFNSLFSTHPSTEKRIEILEQF